MSNRSVLHVSFYHSSQQIGSIACGSASRVIINVSKYNGAFFLLICFRNGFLRAIVLTSKDSPILPHSISYSIDYSFCKFGIIICNRRYRHSAIVDISAKESVIDGNSYNPFILFIFMHHIYKLFYDR